MSVAITVFVVCFLITTCDGVSYYNHALIRGVPYDFEQLKFFKTLDTVYNVTWWRKPSLVHSPVEFSISPRSLAVLFRDTEQMNVRFFTIIRNLQSEFDKDTAKQYTRNKLGTFDWKGYYRLDDIYAWLKDLSSKNPEEVQLRRVGQTHENRTILGVRLKLKGSRNRGKVIVEGGCHGREWISPAFVTYMLYTLLNAKRYRSEELGRVANEYTWTFVPVMNPDGYEYTHTTDRLWTKNRRPSGGVDLNRNYGIAWGKLGLPKRNSAEYCGKGPFSEPESYAMAALTREHHRELKYYLSFHSYGQHIVIPYSHLTEHEDNYDLVKEELKKAVQRMHDNHGMKYKTGNAIETMGYLSSGVSCDWVKRALKTKYVLTFKLPDKGLHGFAIPASQIMSINTATMDGLLPFMDPTPDYMRQYAEFSTTSDGETRRGCMEIVFGCNLLLYVANSLSDVRF